MPEGSLNIILAIIAGLFGAGGIVAFYKATTERRQFVAQAKAQHEQIMAEAHKATSITVVDAFKQITEQQRQRLETVNEQIADLDARLAKERELRDALEARSDLLERKVEALERERVTLNAKISNLERERSEWRKERDVLRARIAELEGCK